jgi:hypothetical protein
MSGEGKSQQVPVRVPQSVRDELVAQAAEEDRSLSYVVRRVLSEWATKRARARARGAR